MNRDPSGRSTPPPLGAGAPAEQRGGWLRLVGFGLALFAGGFVACMTVAAALYPGGTWCEPRASGYDPLRSFFCDVLHARGLNGAPNAGAPWARAALFFAALALFTFWLGLGSALQLSSRRARLVRVIGVLSAGACLVVALTPSDRFPALHQAAVLSSASAGIAAAVIACSGRARGRTARALRRLGWAALVTAGVDAALYLGQLTAPAPCSIALPALQKLAALLVVTWMVAVAVRLSRNRPEGPAFSR